MRLIAVFVIALLVASCGQSDRAERREAAAASEERSGGLLRGLWPLGRSDSAPRQSHSAAGSVCGDPAIRGSRVGRVPGDIAGCGIEDAVSISSVSGISLSTSSTMNCETARALKSWVDTSAKPAWSSKGGGLRELKVAAHYACRRLNNSRTGRISEHGRGRAIDISGFTLRNGSEISVLEGWDARASRRAMRAMWQGACGPFGTVLGPEANRFHLDHFHFDTASHRSGPFCR